jgi:CheY-like chemotaxis protein
LGLATVYGVLHSLRGGFRLCDQPGGGVTAQVYLPVAVAAREVPMLAAPTPALSPSRPRILVVDDDPLVLQMVKDTLQQEGYKVQTAASASEALAAHAVARQQQPFGLVVSDVVMPQTSGVELARQLLTRDRALRLLFMSGQVTEDYLSQDFAARGVELLLKPFRPDGLLRAVHRALTEPRSPVPRNDEPTAAPTVR